MTTHKKDLAEHAEAMGFEVPATAISTEEPVEGELMTDEETYEGGEYSSDIPEHSSEALPIHQRSLPKVALAIGAITVLFGVPAYLFLSAASGGGGATNTAKTDGKDKDKKAGLQDPQTDEINKLKTNLAVGKQLASASPSPSPATSPTADDKTTAKPATPPAAPATVAPTVSPAPVVAKANPQAVAPPPVVAAANPKPSVAPLPVVQPKQLPSVVAKTNSPPVAAAPSTPVVAKAISQPTAAPKVISPAVVKQPVNIPVAKPLAAPSTVLVTKTNPKPIEYTPKNPPVTSTPAVLVKSAPALPPIAKTNPKPIEYAPTNPPTNSSLAARTQPPVALASTPKTPAAPISWEQASASSVYGGDASSIMPAPVGGLGVAAGVKDTGKDSGKQQQSKYEGALSPNLLLTAGTNVKGHTLAPYAVGITKNQSDQIPLSIGLDESIELGKGYHLPVGTTVHFLASVRDNGSVVAVSKNADIGGVEIPLPEGAISLASENNGLLIAKEISTGDGDLARADTNSSIWGGVAGAGRAILQSGSQTTTNTGLLGTTTTQTNNGSPNILGGILEGAFTPLASNGQRRAQQVADRIEQRSKLNEIAVGTKVKLFINVPINVQIPVSGQQVGQAVVPEDDGESQAPPQLVASNSAPVPASQEETPPPPLPQTAVAVQPAAVITPAVVPPQAQPVVPAPVVIPLQPKVTPLPLNPPKTRISIP
jgi:hypothetical protein